MFPSCRLFRLFRPVSGACWLHFSSYSYYGDGVWAADPFPTTLHPHSDLGNRHNIDICSAAKTKKKGKGCEKYQNYCLFYSVKNKEERAYASRYGMKSSNKILKAHIYIKEKLMHTTMNFEKNHGCIIQVWPVA
jgi:hypothetical protein